MTLRERSANIGGVLITENEIVFPSGLDLSAQANDAYLQANTARDQANAAYAQANLAYDAANNAQVTVYANNASNVTTQNVNFVNTATVTVTVTADGANANVEFTAAPQTVVNDTYTAAGNTAAAATANIANGLFGISTSAYDQANAAYGQANTAYDQANTAYDQANTGTAVAQSAYSQANTARSDANTTFATINTTFATLNTSAGTQNTWINNLNTATGTINTHLGNINSTFGTVNTAVTNAHNQANSAYGQANLAYAAANNSNLLSGGLVSGTINVTQDLIVGGNIYLEGNTTYINVSTYSIEDSLVYYASNNKLTDSVDIGFMGGKNTSGTYSHTGLARDATDGKWKLFDGLAEEGHVGNVVDFANTYLATLVANVEANTLSVVNGVSGNVNFDSGTLFIDSENNRVGIGNTSPDKDLVVENLVSSAVEIKAEGNTQSIFRSISSNTGTGYFAFGDTDDVYIGGVSYAHSSDALSFYANNATRATIDSNGNFGIGTTSPGHRLEVSGSLYHRDAYASLGGYNSGGQNTPFNRYGATFGTNITGGQAEVNIWNPTDPATYTSTGILFSQALSATTRRDLMFLKHDGLVGVGTLSPTGRLHAADAGFDPGNSNITKASFVASGNYGGGITLNDGGLGTIWMQGTGTLMGFGIGTTSGASGTMYMRNGSVGIAQIPTVSTTSSLFNNGDFTIAGSNRSILGNIYYSGGWKYAANGYGWGFRENASGLVQFITFPNNTSGAGAAASDTYLMTLDIPNQRVGIGTVSPGQKLEVNGAIQLSSSNPIYFFNTNYFVRASTGLELQSGDLIRFLTNGANERMRIVTNGDVGIGTSSPATKLHVVGSTRIDHTVGNTNLENGNGLQINGAYTNGQYSHRLRKWDDGGGVPLYVQFTEGTANTWSNLAKFGPNSADSSSLTVYGTARAYRASGDNMGVQILGGDSNNSYLRVQNSTASVDYGQGNGSAFVNVNNNQGWYVATGGSSRFEITGAGAVNIRGTSFASEVIYGNNGMGVLDTASDMNTLNQKSGFYLRDNPTNGPFGTWTTWLQLTGHYVSDNYGWQLAKNYWGNDWRIRSLTNNSWGSWLGLVLYGNNTSAGDVYATRFYDANDTNVFFDGGELVLRSISPTIYFRDTDHFSAMLHCNSQLLYVLRGATDTTAWSQVNGQWPFIFYLGNNDALCGGSFSAVGNVTAYSSDRRLKTNIQKIPNALDKVLSLNGVTFDWIDRVKELGFTPDTMINDAGVIAQEVQEVLPQAVKPAPFDYQWDNDKNANISRSGEDFITVQYEKLVPLLIEAIKELKSEIDTLKQRG